MSEINDNSAPSRPRRTRKNYALLILAAGMLAFGVAAATLYYVVRPTTLRIAVGPAGSDDQKLIQLMAQTFAREGSPGWPAYSTTDRATMVFDKVSRVHNDPYGAERRAWEEKT